MKSTIITTDLRQQAPRSPRVRIGGLAHLPRLIDKARATAQGTVGVYEYGEQSLLDREFFAFTGITPDSFLEQATAGFGDWALYQWVIDQGSQPLAPYQIQAWSHWLETLPGLSPDARAWFAEYAATLNPARPDVSTLFEYLDLDDYVRFGGAA